MLLENEVDKRIANNRQFLDPNRNRRLSVDEKHVIVWGWSRGWSASLYIQMDGHKFQCRICGEIRTTRTDLLWFLTLICFCVSPRWSRDDLQQPVKVTGALLGWQAIPTRVSVQT